MNFLAHLHLASLANSSLLGNLLADFVRGNPEPVYSADVADGIMLHRRIDSLTDALPQVRNAKKYFSPHARKVSPIVLDVLWDHFLSLHWDKIEPRCSLPEFTARAYRYIQPKLAETPEAFQNLNRYLWRERWLERYAELPFIEQVLERMAQRRPRLFALSQAFPDIEGHYAELEKTFWQFYPHMMTMAQQRQL